MTGHPCEPIGLADIARRYRLNLPTLKQQRWRARRGSSTPVLPPPDWKVGDRPLWCRRHTLDPWAATLLTGSNAVGRAVAVAHRIAEYDQEVDDVPHSA